MSKVIMILGGDGYIGWSLGLNLAINTNHHIVLVDSYLKRILQKKLGVEELNPSLYLYDKIKEYKKVTGKTNLESACLDVSNFSSIRFFIDKVKPDIIVNAAQQPSAPLSMMSPQMAALTFSNNEQTILNVMWAVAQCCPDTKIINMGSSGTYLSTNSDFIPDKRVSLTFRLNGEPHYISDSWVPMQTSDFYHLSKVNTFALTDMCSKMWNLKIITIQQSTVFGQCSCDIPYNLYSRMNYDQFFGTALNRFICQAVSGHPLTIYGDGENKTNIISLYDTIATLKTAIGYSSIGGQHKVINNFTDQMSINEIAKMVVGIYGKGEIVYIKNPRKEDITDDKKFERFVSKTKGSIGVSIIQTIDFVENFRYNIKTHLFNPTVRWNIN